MGRNVDVNELLNLWEINCPICAYNISELFEEIDMDCDTKSHHPLSTEVFVRCLNCDNEVKMKINVELNIERV